MSYFYRRHLDRRSRRAARLPDPSQRVRQAALGQAVRANHQTGQGWHRHAAISHKTFEGILRQGLGGEFFPLVTSVLVFQHLFFYLEVQFFRLTC